MTSLSKVLAAAVALTVAVPAVAAETPKEPKEARIAFANHGGIYNWRAVDRDTLLIQGQGKHWYKAELFAPAFNLKAVETIGFETSPGDTFDRYSSIIVEGRRYPLRSLVEVPPPAEPAKPKKSS